MKIFFLILSANLLFNVNVYSQDDWELIRNESNIEVYFRAVENSNYFEMKTTSIVKTDIETIFCVLTDFENIPNWSYGTINAYTISTTSNLEYIYYQRSEMPWPVYDRECVIKIKMAKLGSNKLTSQSSGLKGFVEENEDCTRIYDLSGLWTFEILDDKSIKMTYYLKLNPGLGIPDWLIKMAADTAPFTSFVNIKEEFKKEKYINCDFDFE